MPSCSLWCSHTYSGNANITLADLLGAMQLVDESWIGSMKSSPWQHASLAQAASIQRVQAIQPPCGRCMLVRHALVEALCCLAPATPVVIQSFMLTVDCQVPATSKPCNGLCPTLRCLQQATLVQTVVKDSEQARQASLQIETMLPCGLKGCLLALSRCEPCSSICSKGAF